MDPDPDSMGPMDPDPVSQSESGGQKFVAVFFSFLVIKTLDPDPDPDPDSLEMLDPDPHLRNPDPSRH